MGLKSADDDFPTGLKALSAYNSGGPDQPSILRHMADKTWELRLKWEEGGGKFSAFVTKRTFKGGNFWLFEGTANGRPIELLWDVTPGNGGMLTYTD